MTLAEENRRLMLEDALRDEMLNPYFRRLIKELFFGGFDTYEDYVKYGDAFIQIETKEVRNDVMNT
jgi:hypothetical protein